MDNNELRKHLQELQDEIENATENVDEKARELLDNIKNDIRELLDRDDDEKVQAEPATLERLQESIAALEASHPTLTSMMTQALNTLSNAGI
jgi:polyhydroxyalkanoate synthesis regulator phasin